MKKIIPLLFVSVGYVIFSLIFLATVSSIWAYLENFLNKPKGLVFESKDKHAFLCVPDELLDKLDTIDKRNPLERKEGLAIVELYGTEGKLQFKIPYKGHTPKGIAIIKVYDEDF